MSFTLQSITDALWRNALAIVPLVILVALICRFVPCRPATRHSLWVLVLAWLVLAPFVPAPPVNIWSTAEPSTAMSFDAPTDSVLVRSETSPVPNDAESTAIPTFESPDLPLPEESVAVAHEPLDTPTMTVWPLAPVGLVLNSDWLSRIADSSPTPTEPRTVTPSGPLVSEVAMHQNRDREGAALMTEQNRDRKEAAAKSPRHRSRSTTTSFGENHRIASSSNAPAIGLCDSVSNFAAHPTAEVSQPIVPRNDDRNENPLGVCQPIQFAESPVSAIWWRVKSEFATRIIEPVSAFGTSWAATARRAWEGLSQIPTPSATAWWAGSLLVGLIILLRACWFARTLRGATAAPPELQHTVDSLAARMGLRRSPKVVVVNGRFSPMIWCFRGPTLVIPKSLWAELDAAGREAVLCHELAHLRRRDHWFIWFELLIGCVYWWHPLVWWIRGRVRAAAEDSCDAWVTWLLPKQRRAYAEALLRTRTFVGSTMAPAPIGGMGALSGRAVRLARRIRMVMTQRITPNLSVSGVGLVALMALAGWLVAPVQSCPPDEKEAKKPCNEAPVAVVSAPTPPGRPAPPAPPAPPARAAHPAPPAPPTPPPPPGRPGAAWRPGPGSTPAPAIAPIALFGNPNEDGRTFERHVARGAGNSSGGSDKGMEDRLRRLEERLQKLNEQLERMHDTIDRARGKVDSQAHRHVHEDMHDDEEDDDGDDDELTWRTYRISPGKLEGLTALMSRSDVPIFVRPQQGAIEVQANEDQHEVFEEFVKMIDPDQGGRGSRPVNRAGAFSPAPVPQPPPPPPPPGRTGSRNLAEQEFLQALVMDTAAAQANDEHAAALAQAELAMAMNGGSFAHERDEHAAALAEAELAYARLMQTDGDAHAIAAAADANAQAVDSVWARLGMLAAKTAASAVTTTSAQSKSRAEVLEVQADELDAQADALAEEAEQLSVAADDIDEQCEELRAKNESSFRSDIRQLESDARRMRRESDRILAKTERIRQRASALRDSAAEAIIIASSDSGVR